jgi:hypothetical protein
MALHYMQAFLLLAWVIKDLTRINRKFLWGGLNSNFSGGHCLLPWKQVTLPKRFGGLGIRDLQLQNEALLAKWIWIAYQDTNALWATTLHTLYISIPLEADLPEQEKISFFIHDLLTL